MTLLQTFLMLTLVVAATGRAAAQSTQTRHEPAESLSRPRPDPSDAGVASAAGPAGGSSIGGSIGRSVGRLAPVVRTVSDGMRRVPTVENTILMGAACASSVAVLAHDRSLTARAVATPAFDRLFDPGEVLGGGAMQVGGALAAYTAGRLFEHRRATALGSDLLRAQLLNGVLTHGIKLAVRRTRPDSGPYSFPSGHASATFATATVLGHHFGWKVGTPAHAVAAFVAASRLSENRHYTSDVVFGAAIGIVAGRAIRVGKGERQFTVAPIAAPGTTGIAILWAPKGR